MNPKWITVNRPSGDSSLYVFKKTFTLNKPVAGFYVRVSADTRYKLFINGKEMSHGPCQSSKFIKYYEEVECAEALVMGQNEITVKVLHISSEDQYWTAFRESRPALYFYGVLELEDEKRYICSDESFQVFLTKNVSYHNRESILPSVPPFEEITGIPELIELGGEILYEPNADLLYHTRWGMKEKYRLEKRPIPPIKSGKKEELTAVKEYTDENGNYNMILDAGRYTTAMLSFDFLADAGTKIKIIYTECAMTRREDGSLYKDMRDDIDGVINSTAFDLIFALGNKQGFEPFFYRAFRFIRVEFSKKPHHFRAFAARYTYNFVENATNGGVGSFECSNEKYNQMWEISKNTVECTAHEIFADCSFYEQQQYVGDGRFEAVFAWRYSNDSALMRKMIIDTAHSQQEDGQLVANYPNIYTQIIQQSSLGFVYLLRDYLRFTGDTDFVRTMTGVCDRALEYYHGFIDADGLTNPIGGWRFLDWVRSWNVGVPIGGEKAPLTMLCLMYIKALNDAVEICDACGRAGLAAEYSQRSRAMIDAVNRHCYDNENGFYTDVPGIKAYSEHTTVWAILAKAIVGEEARKLAERTLKSETVAKCSFSKNYDLLRALDTVGIYSKYAESILTQWQEMMDKHCTSWCEDAVTKRSECHGWSSVPAYEMSAMALGVTAAENGFKRVLIRPVLLGLKYARGRVPTPYGYIDVSWYVKDGRFYLDVNSSSPVEMEIICPGGKREKIFASIYSVCE